MKPATLLLTGSLVLNAAGVSVLLMRPALAPPAMRPLLPGGGAPEPAAVAAPAVAAPRAAAPRRLWPMLDSGGDLPTLIARLRAAGFPPDLVRGVVVAELSARYDPRIRALFEPPADTPFWKLGTSMMSVGDQRMEQYSQLQRERARLQRELLADPFFATDDVTALQRRKYGNLSRQKIDLLERIEEDYSEMNSAIRAGTQGILLAEDREKLELLARERRADLAGVLTPAELAEYEIRSSPVTSTLARHLAGFDATEAEFRAIFQAQAAFSERSAPGLTSYSPEIREAATRQLHEQLKTALGPARYAEYVRETDPTFQQLLRLTEREKLPRETALRAFHARDTVVQESARIADDPALDGPAKRAALQALAARARTEVLGILGTNIGPSYIQILDARWLKMVERGSAVSFDTSRGASMMGFGSVNSTPVMISLGVSPTFRPVGAPPPPPGR